MSKIVENAYFDKGVAAIFAGMVNTICPKCSSRNVVPVIFGLIERKDLDVFYDDEKIIGLMAENNLVENPGCVPDSYMNDKKETPTKYCHECNLYFDFKENGV